jgi:hypothetical protein
MTDPVQEPTPEAAETAEAAPASPLQRRDRAAPVLAAAFVVVVALVAASPLWAPGLMPLLPWGTAGNGSPRTPDTQISARLDRLETAVNGLTKAVAAATAANRAGITALGTTDKAALAALDRRVQALETKPPPDLSGLQQQMQEQMQAATAQLGGLGKRVDALEKAMQKAAVDPADMAASLIVLQIDAALRAARPFPGEYATLATLVRNRPELAAAAAPLAGPAKSGVASRAVLTRKLHNLAAHIAEATPPPASDDLTGQIMARLRSLVTIRRTGGAGQTPAESAVNTAETAMRQGDLAGAVTALRSLSGASAEAAMPWLKLAEPRLQAEAALDRLTTLLAARLGKPAAPVVPG